MIDAAFKQRCESIAIQRRHRLNKKAYEPLGATNLAQDLGVLLHTPEQLPDVDDQIVLQAMQSQQWSALSVVGDPIIVIYHPRLSFDDFEWTIMHELAHLLLLHEPESLGSLDGKYICRQYNKQNETEANVLADYLKFPRAALNYTRQVGFSDNDIMERFGIGGSLLQRQRKQR